MPKYKMDYMMVLALVSEVRDFNLIEMKNQPSKIFEKFNKMMSPKTDNVYSFLCLMAISP